MSSGDDLGSFPPAGMVVGPRSQPGSPANLMRRCVPVVIDLAIAVAVVLGPLVTLDRILTAASVADGPAGTIWRTSAAVWSLAFLLLYSPLSVSRWGGTVGKRLLGTEVVRVAGGGRLTYGPAVARHMSNIVVNAVPVFLIANVSAINLSEKKQGLHDRLVGSVVVMRDR
ncbi:RDD family protein [Streptomyces sp. NPDC001978]|uniref:RDD family protein n=1 Tax=Streptomyces sp. NPDC001978 TaxID=3364627 RepID=UPI0036C6579F